MVTLRHDNQCYPPGLISARDAENVVLVPVSIYESYGLRAWRLPSTVTTLGADGVFYDSHKRRASFRAGNIKC